MLLGKRRERRKTSKNELDRRRRQVRASVHGMGVHRLNTGSPRSLDPSRACEGGEGSARNAPEVHYSRSIFRGTSVQKICKSSGRMWPSRGTGADRHGWLRETETAQQWRRAVSMRCEPLLLSSSAFSIVFRCLKMNRRSPR